MKRNGCLGCNQLSRRLNVTAMNLRKTLPLRLIVGLVLAVVLDTTLQVFWKVAVIDVPGQDASFLQFIGSALSSPMFLFVIFLMALQFFNWLVVLANADLSYAHPVTSLSYVTVFALSILYLNQETDPIQALGVAFVLAGVWFISRTEHKTPARDFEVL
jgi:drug/metabolite transporter (DMT)-like permease